MTKPKDPEVVDEMEAADGTTDDEARRAADAALAEDAEPAEDAEARPEESAEPDAGAVEPGADTGAEGEAATGAEEGTEELAEESVESAASDVAEAEHLGEEATAAAGVHAAEERLAQAEDQIEEPGHRSLAATALWILVGVIAVVVGALWAAPRVAPHLPASVAQYLMPGQFEAAAEIATLRESLDATTGQTAERIAALEARVAAAEAAGEETASTVAALPDQAPVAAEAAEALKQAGAAGAEIKALLRRTDAAETELIGLRESLAAINTALAEARESGNGSGAVPAEIPAALAALNTRIDTLASAVANRAELKALQDRIDAFNARIDALEAGAAEASDQQSRALGEVSTAIHAASLRSAVAALTSQLRGGLPYAVPLDEVAALTEAEPPEALTVGAEDGLTTATKLGAGFGPYAQAAVAADVRASTEGGAGSQVLGWLRSQVTVRPVGERAGDGVGAVTSRIAARVSEADLAAALAEAETLPPHARAALGGWLDQLRARVAAEEALASWLAEIGVNG